MSTMRQQINGALTALHRAVREDPALQTWWNLHYKEISDAGKRVHALLVSEGERFEVGERLHHERPGAPAVEVEFRGYVGSDGAVVILYDGQDRHGQLQTRVEYLRRFHPGEARPSLEKKTPPPKRSTAMTYRKAQEWALTAARTLIGNTVFENGRMIKDEAGASAATYPALLGFSDSSPEDDGPLVFLQGLEVLRVHSRGQLDRGDWEAAYKAVAKEAKARPELDDERAGPAPAIGSALESPKSGLSDGSRYKLLSDRLRIRLPAEQGSGKSGAVALLEGCLPRAHWSRHQEPGESYAAWVDIWNGSTLDVLADCVEKRHPKLAAIIRQRHERWSRHIGDNEAPLVQHVGFDREGRIAIITVGQWPNLNVKEAHASVPGLRVLSGGQHGTKSTMYLPSDHRALDTLTSYLRSNRYFQAAQKIEDDIADADLAAPSGSGVQDHAEIEHQGAGRYFVVLEPRIELKSLVARVGKWPAVAMDRNKGRWGILLDEGLLGKLASVLREEGRNASAAQVQKHAPGSRNAF